jgi:DNA-binding GntR family transcriptional regulator
MVSLGYDLNHTTLSEKIKNYLIDCIINKKTYRSGDKIVETQIAKELNVSQAPVREAIKDLKIIGFIESVPYKGSYIKEVSAQELKDVYSVRSVLEELAVKQAFENIDQTLIEKMQSIVEQMTEAARTKNFIYQTELDWEFHNLIASAANNLFLAKIFSDLGIKYWILRGITFLAGHNMFDYEAQALRHQPILEALKSKDLETAITLIREHYEQNTLLIESIKDCR